MTEPVKRDDGWSFTYDGQEVGPYNTRAEAEADRRGLARFDKHHNDPDWLTTDPTLLMRLME